MEQTLYGATIVTERYNRGIFDLINVLRPVVVEHALDGESVGLRRNSGSDWELPGAFGFSQFMILSTNEAFIDALAAIPVNADGYQFEKVTESLQSMVDLDSGTFQPEEMRNIGLFGDEGATEYIALRDRIAAEDAAPLTDAELTEAVENIVSPVSAPLEVSFNGAQLSGAELTVIDEAGNEIDPEDEEFDAFDEDEDDDWYDDEEDDDFFDDEDDDFDDDWDDDEEDWEDD